MTTRELMIGNYVMAINNYEDIFYVNCIYGYRDLNITSGIYKNYDTTIRDVKPIPLTEEWMIKFGFEKRPDVDVYDSDGGSNCTEFYKKDGVSISFYRGNFWDATINHELDFNLEYVHLLQNFWMCYKQEELTIKNK